MVCRCIDCRDTCCVSVNKRLDDWIPMDLMDLSRLEPPKKENKTPMKVMNGSRPSSPDREIVRFDMTYLLFEMNSLSSLFTHLHVLWTMCLSSNYNITERMAAVLLSVIMTFEGLCVIIGCIVHSVLITSGNNQCPHTFCLGRNIEMYNFSPHCIVCKRGLAICLSVHHMRVHVLWQTNENSANILILYESEMHLVFWHEEWLVGDVPFYLNFEGKLTLSLQKWRFSIDIRS